MHKKRLPNSTAKPLKAGRSRSTKRVRANLVHQAVAAVVVAATAAVAMVVEATAAVAADMVAVAADAGTAANAGDAKSRRNNLSVEAALAPRPGKFALESSRALSA